MRFHGRKHTYYPLTDIQGTVWGYADAGNNVVACWQYDAWGSVLSEVCTVPALATIRYRFQGREWSAATGLINFRMRWYDPETGRWLSKDPIGLSGGLNLYAFCGNNPVNGIDPLGLWGIWFGPIHFGNDEPWLVFNSDSLDDLKNGFAVGLDGFIPMFDPFESVYSDECGNHDGVYEISKLCGSISFTSLTMAFAAPSGLSLGGGSLQTVTHYSPTIQTTLKSGDWVMTGGNTFRNWIMAGGPQKIGAWTKSLTTTVPKSSLLWPSGWEWVKGLLGQRIYMP